MNFWQKETQKNANIKNNQTVERADRQRYQSVYVICNNKKMRRIFFLLNNFKHLPQKLNLAEHDANENERWTMQKKELLQNFMIWIGTFFFHFSYILFIVHILLSPNPSTSTDTGAGSVYCMCNGCEISLYIVYDVCIFTKNYIILSQYFSLYSPFVHHAGCVCVCGKWFMISYATNFVVQWWKSLQWMAAICNVNERKNMAKTIIWQKNNYYL